MARIWTWFTGRNLYVCSTTRGAIASFPAVSGKPRLGSDGTLQFKYDAKSQGQKDDGPLPEGNYKFRLGDVRVYEHTRSTYAKSLAVGVLDFSVDSAKAFLDKTNAAWGEIPGRAGRIIPILNQHGGSTYANGRDNCWIHGSDSPGSIGCIDLTVYMERFLATLEREVPMKTADIPLSVRYGISPKGSESREVDDRGRDISRIA